MGWAGAVGEASTDVAGDVDGPVKSPEVESDGETGEEDAVDECSAAAAPSPERMPSVEGLVRNAGRPNRTSVTVPDEVDELEDDVDDDRARLTWIGGSAGRDDGPTAAASGSRMERDTPRLSSFAMRSKSSDLRSQHNDATRTDVRRSARRCSRRPPREGQRDLERRRSQAGIGAELGKLR